MTEPDFDRLAEVNAKLRKLEEDGKLTRAAFGRLLQDAEKAVGGHEEFLEGILNEGMRLGFVDPD